MVYFHPFQTRDVGYEGKKEVLKINKNTLPPHPTRAQTSTLLFPIGVNAATQAHADLTLV